MTDLIGCAVIESIRKIIIDTKISEECLEKLKKLEAGVVLQSQGSDNAGKFTFQAILDIIGNGWPAHDGSIAGIASRINRLVMQAA